MNKNTLIAALIGLLLAIGVYAFILYKSSEGFKNKLKVKETELLELRNDYYVLETDFEVLEEKKNKIIYRESKTQKQLNDQIDETNSIPGIVSSYNVSKLDSILANHRHIQRTEN